MINLSWTLFRRQILSFCIGDYRHSSEGTILSIDPRELLQLQLLNQKIKKNSRDISSAKKLPESQLFQEVIFSLKVSRANINKSSSLHSMRIKVKSLLLRN